MSVSVKYSPFSKKKPKRGFSGKSFAGSFSFPAYTGCSLLTTTGSTYYAVTPTIALGTVLYTNSQLITLAASIEVYLIEPSFDNGVYVATDEFGVIVNFTRCSINHNLYDLCNNNGAITTYYTKYNDALATGIVLYSDSDLVTLATNISPSLDGIIYQTNGNGVITINYCNTPISPVYANCTDYNNSSSSTTYYIRDIEYGSPLINGTKVYTDVVAISELNNTTFVWNNNVYDYTAGIGTSLTSVCNT